MKSPVAQRKLKKFSKFGKRWSDPYYWLRDKKNPDVIRYLKAENRYTESAMADTKTLQRKIYREILGRTQQTDLSVPLPRGDYFYYWREEKGKQYGIYCRKFKSMKAKEEVLLDLNVLARGKKFFSLAGIALSPDQRFLAYATDTTGAEIFNIHFKDLKTKRILSDSVPEVADDLIWANDNRTLLYTKNDSAHRPYRVFRHELGTNFKKDKMIYEERDQRFRVGLDKTQDRKFLLLEIGSHTTTEVHLMDASRPTSGFQIFAKRKQDVRYWIEHNGDRFFILTDERAKNFKLMTTPEKKVAKRFWKIFLSERKDVSIENLKVFKDRLVLIERKDAIRQLRIFDLRRKTNRYLKFPEGIYDIDIQVSSPLHYDSKFFRFHYESFTTPESVYDYDFASGKIKLRKQQIVPSGYNPKLYRAERQFAIANDGTKIPLSVIYRKNLKRSKNNFTVLDAYGSYGLSRNPNFSVERLSLLDRGVVVVIAHIRGGGEMGPRWHDAGKMLKKKNTFADFISAAEKLIQSHLTSGDRLIIRGGSAGGLLMGAVINARPELFKGVVAHVPFVDIVQTMLDSSLPLTIGEYEEWGNPANKKYFKTIWSYAPYENVSAQNYPSMLVMTGLNDTRVSYWEPAKWIAKLRATKTDSNLLLLKTEMIAGHSGVSGRYDGMKETAFEYAFVLKIFNLK